MLYRLPLNGFRAAGGGSGFRANGFAEDAGLEAAGLIGDADEEHGLTGILQNVDDAFGAFFEIDGFAVGDQVEVGVGGENFGEALAHFALEEAEDAADFLEGESFAAEFSDDGDFEDFLGVINAAMAFVAGGDDFAFIPPLQLAETDAADAGDVG